MADVEQGMPVPEPVAPSPESGNEPFLSRWARLKREARDRPVEPPRGTPDAVDPQAAPPDLPPLEKLTFDSDYRQFFHPEVGEPLRRAALKKLFSDPRFNVMDGLDVYIDDYSKTEPIPAAMLASLKQAQNILRWARGEQDEPRKEQAGEDRPPPVADAAQGPLEPPVAQPVPGVEPGMTAPAAVPFSDAG